MSTEKTRLGSLQLESGIGSCDLVRKNSNRHFFDLLAKASSTINRVGCLDMFNHRKPHSAKVFRSGGPRRVFVSIYHASGTFFSAMLNDGVSTSPRAQKNLRLCRFGAFENPQCSWAP